MCWSSNWRQSFRIPPGRGFCSWAFRSVWCAKLYLRQEKSPAYFDAGLICSEFYDDCPSLHDHSGEDVRLEHDQHADQAGQRDRMEEHEAQDRTFVSKPVARG